MSLADGKTLEIAALGRPFNLGMLYDFRRDTLVPGITLWDPEKLKEDMRETPKPNSEFEIMTSESIADKSSSLGVDPSLKASFLSGLVTVDGSAKYLNDSKISKKQVRATLKYKTTTKFKELTMNQLGRANVKHSYVFEQGLATHVVTAILYGAQAFFVFDREVTEKESHRDIQGKLEFMIKNIPKLSNEVDVSLTMENKDKEVVDRFSCRFHGDFCLSHSPVSFEDAVKVYQDLPILLGPDGEKAVPVKVWLLPLSSLDSAAAKYVRQISVSLVQDLQSIMENFGDLEMRCNDLLKTAAARQFKQTEKIIRNFKMFCSKFKMNLQETLATKLPAIRGGGEEEVGLAEILQNIHSSPFNNDCLSDWMECRENQINTITSLTKIMKNTKIASSKNILYEKTMSVKNVLCFGFTLLDNPDPYLSALEDYLKGVHLDSGSQVQDVEDETSYFSKAKLFNDFAEANKGNDDILFLVMELQNEHKGLTVYLYEDGEQVSDNFHPPSKPDKLTVKDIKHNCATLKISPPRHGCEAITDYRVEYCIKGEDEWHHQTKPKADEVTVTGLRPDTEYIFRARAVTDVGVGPAAEIKSSVKTLPDPADHQDDPRRVAEVVRKNSRLLEIRGSLSILKVPLTENNLNVSKYRSFIYGQDSLKSHYTIMVLGATGAGKSTLINLMINYIFGVKWKDSYRFKLEEDQGKSQTQSQTSKVTVYKIHHQHGFQIDYSLTIIDTPGFGDPRGIEKDKEITEQIKNLFLDQSGVNILHAICFVAQSHMARLTVSQRYLFDSVLSIFGKDVAENIRIFVTFSDTQQPLVLEAIKEAEVPCPKTEDSLPEYFKFNNCALFAENQSSVVDKSYWDKGYASIKNFFDTLYQIEPQSLTLTKEVLQERERLEVLVDNYKALVREEAAKSAELKEMGEKLQEHEEEIKRNKDFEIEVSCRVAAQEQISTRTKYVTNCSECQYTCHYPCKRSSDQDKKNCCVMDKTGNCTACPGKCHWAKHHQNDYRWVYEQGKKKHTLTELKEKFLKASDAKKPFENLTLKLKEEKKKQNAKLSEMIRKATQAKNRLENIALKRNPLSGPEYIELIMYTEKSEATPGWKERFEILESVKEDAKILDKITNESNPPQ